MSAIPLAIRMRRVGPLCSANRKRRWWLGAVGAPAYVDWTAKFLPSLSTPGAGSLNGQRRLAAAATDERPKLRYPAGKAARRVGKARRYAPATVFDKQIRKLNNLPA
jgi:hypothetical protein